MTRRTCTSLTLANLLESMNASRTPPSMHACSLVKRGGHAPPALASTCALHAGNLLCVIADVCLYCSFTAAYACFVDQRHRAMQAFVSLGQPSTWQAPSTHMQMCTCGDHTLCVGSMCAVCYNLGRRINACQELQAKCMMHLMWSQSLKPHMAEALVGLAPGSPLIRH